jgi:hypothetical protein
VTDSAVMWVFIRMSTRWFVFYQNIYIFCIDLIMLFSGGGILHVIVIRYVVNYVGGTRLHKIYGKWFLLVDNN